MGLDIQQLLLDTLQSSAVVQNSAKRNNAELAKKSGELGVLNSDSAEAITTVALNKAASEDQILKGAQQAQDASRRFAQAAGTDINDPAQILVSLGEDLRKQVLAAREAQARIQAKESTTILNPVQFLVSQLTLKDDYKQYNHAADNANLTSDNIAALTAATDQVGQTQRGLAQKITDASRAAAAQATIAQGELDKNAAERNHIKDELAIAAAIQQGTAAQALETQKQFGFVMDSQRWEMQQAQFAQQKEEYNFNKQIKLLSLKKDLDKAAVDSELLRQYNAGAMVLGYQPQTNFELIKSRAELGGADLARISAIMEAGSNSLSIGAARVTATPAGATAMIAKNMYPRSNEPQFAGMRKYLTDNWEQQMVANGHKEANAGIALNAKVANDTAFFEKNAVATGSFYAPPPIESITATASVKKTALYQKVLATAGKDLRDASPDPIIKLAYTAAANKVISYEEAAAGIAEFYGQAVVINNLNNRYSQIGIKPQTSFRVTPSIPGANNLKGVNLTDYSSTLHLMATIKARTEFGITQNLPSFLGM